MKKNPEVKLTVVVLTYNSGKTVKACLDSLVKQTRKEFKLFIVDDDSIDDTLSIVKKYSAKLNIEILMNGAHNISRGRNIGLRAAKTPYTAFMDSDARADINWVDTIIKKLSEPSAPSLISGEVNNAHRTDAAKAIALNDETIRDLFWKGNLVQGCNFALNHKALNGLLFDEKFIHADDLDYIWKVEQQHQSWLYVDNMIVHHQSRSSFKEYFNQMYKYGFWKVYFGYRSKQYNWIDYVPLTIFIISVIASIKFPVAILVYPILCVAETLFIVLYKRPTFRIIPYILLAWIIKNTAWSLGLIKAAYKLLTSKEQRDMVLQKSEILA